MWWVVVVGGVGVDFCRWLFWVVDVSDLVGDFGG